MVKLKERHTNHPCPTSYELKNGVVSQVREGSAAASVGVVGLVRSVFLPEGYPESVSEDYLEYQAWDTVQAFASSISGSLATAAVLGGLGVGDSEATPLAATMTWILKDGAGMLGRIVFAAMVNTSLDYDCKRWRLFADILNDCVMCVELCAGLLPRPLVLPTLCVTGVGRSLVGVAGGATKAAVAQHQARRNNMADLSAKDGSQETLVNLLALCINLILLPLVSDTPHLPFLLFLCLAALHIYSNFRAVSCLVFTSLNLSRLTILLDHYKHHNTILSPRVVNTQEPVLRPCHGLVSVTMGVSVRCVRKEEVEQVETMVAREEPYCLLARQDNSYRVLLSSTATPKHVYQAFTQCYLGRNDVESVLDNIQQSGWDLDTLALGTLGYRIQIKS